MFKPNSWTDIIANTGFDAALLFAFILPLLDQH
jgi:hypothetical protein